MDEAERRPSIGIRCLRSGRTIDIAHQQSGGSKKRKRGKVSAAALADTLPAKKRESGSPQQAKSAQAPPAVEPLAGGNETQGAVDEFNNNVDIHGSCKESQPSLQAAESPIELRDGRVADADEAAASSPEAVQPAHSIMRLAHIQPSRTEPEPEPEPRAVPTSTGPIPTVVVIDTSEESTYHADGSVNVPVIIRGIVDLLPKRKRRKALRLPTLIGRDPAALAPYEASRSLLPGLSPSQIQDDLSSSNMMDVVSGTKPKIRYRYHESILPEDTSDIDSLFEEAPPTPPRPAAGGCDPAISEMAKAEARRARLAALIQKKDSSDVAPSTLMTAPKAEVVPTSRPELDAALHTQRTAERIARLRAFEEAEIAAEVAANLRKKQKAAERAQAGQSGFKRPFWDDFAEDDIAWEDEAAKAWQKHHDPRSQTMIAGNTYDDEGEW